MKNLRIVFMGTPEFAVATLGSLLMNGFNVVGVVTSPDKPSGRGRKINKSAVKEFAEFSYLPIFQPDNLKDAGFITLNIDLIQMGVGGNDTWSDVSQPLEKYQIPAKDYEYSFYLLPATIKEGGIGEKVKRIKY